MLSVTVDKGEPSVKLFSFDELKVDTLYKCKSESSIVMRDSKNLYVFHPGGLMGTCLLTSDNVTGGGGWGGMTYTLFDDSLILKNKK